MDKEIAETVMQHLTDDLIDLQIQRKPNCIVEFTVKAKPALVKKAHSKAIGAVAKQTSVPGFRKGKAPEDLILLHFEKDVNKQWERIIGEEVFRHCQELSNISPINEQSRVGFSLKSHSLKDGAEMSFQFETEPAVPAIDISQITLTPVDQEEVTDENVDETIRRIQLFFSKWTAIPDRAVQDQDFIIVDLDTIAEDGTLERVFSNTRLEVGSPTMAPWMKELVLGMHVGESKEGISAPDESASQEDKDTFQPKKVKVTLLSAEMPVLPECDDEFAKKLGADSVETMRARLKQLLKKQHHEKQQHAYRDEVSHKLLGLYPFDVPASLLHAEVQHRFKQLSSDASFRKRIDKMSDEEKKAEVDHIKNQAQEALRLFYICKKVILDNHISLSESELIQDIHTPLDMLFADPSAAKPNKTEEEKNLLMSKLLLTKAQDFIIDKIL